MSLHPFGKCSLLLSLVTPIANAQEVQEYKKRPITAHRCEAAPVIDGDLNDPVWTLAPQAITFVDRESNSAVRDQTIGYVAHDDQYIYVAFRCTDSEPDRVEARETVRDSKYSTNDDNPNKEDNVTFTIDPYYSKKSEDLSVFSVNALGTPSAKVAGGRGGKLEWKGKWDSASKRTPTGYDVEFRIPWAMLNYPAGTKPCTMGINFYRYQYHNKQESVWSNVTNFSFTDLEGQWQGVIVPKSAFKPKLSLLPYVLPSIKDDEFRFRSGLDARLTVTPDLTAVGSLNPDFNTIEGAVEGIAFSRVERFIPERRPFFLEGDGYFSPGTRFNDIGAFFYPRRIDTFDFGTKVYGKITPTDSIGVLNTMTFGKRMDNVVRYKHGLSPTSDVGIFASQKAVYGADSSAIMVDQHARFGALGLESQFAKTSGLNSDGGAVVLSANYQRGTNISLLQYHTIAEDFKIANGFIPYTNYHGFYGFTDFNGRWKGGQYQSYDYGAYGLAWDHQDGSRYQRSLGWFGSLFTRGDMRFSLSQDYAIIDDTVDSTVTGGVTFGVSNRFRKIRFDVTSGRLSSRPATFLLSSASFRVFKKLDLGYSGSILNLEGVTNQHTLTLGYELSPTRSFGGRLVSQNSDTNWYLSYRSAGGRGTDFYVVLGDPNARKFQRLLQVKFVFSY